MSNQRCENFNSYLERIISSPPVTTSMDGINLKPTSTYDYVIAWERCATPALIFGWIEHLSRKRWCTPALLVAFIAKACKYHGFQIDRDL